MAEETSTTTTEEIVRADGDQITTRTTTRRAADFVLARIKPYNKKVGLTVRTYTFKGYRFREENGWYKIPAELGEELKELAVDDNDPYSPYLFDVLGESEAQALEDKERKRRERATANRPNQTPDIRRGSTRRLTSATSAAQRQGDDGVVTTSSLRAPNDESIPNGYPPSRVYPQPSHGGVPQVSQLAATAVETGHDEQDDDVIEAAKAAGVDDKTLSRNATNLTRDMNGGAPVLIDGQGEDDDEISVEGSTDFGADDPAVRDDNAPAAPPSARRRRRG